MRKVLSVLASMTLLAGAFAISAQRPRQSPHETVSSMVGGKRITIVYGRPFAKGRDVWAAPIAPAGKVWRAGADEATLLALQGDIMLGSLHVPAGAYTLFVITGETEWTLIVNKMVGQWGLTYNEQMDLGRVKMAVAKAAAPVEQLTIGISGVEGNKATLKIAWAEREASIPVMMH
ncbi:MAG: DUF2911 domain-containing protein [Acidobacteria bacterium]|nr:DUF2911 domain-containing protein [Acidobacteriota bacterium]